VYSYKITRYAAKKIRH